MRRLTQAVLAGLTIVLLTGCAEDASHIFTHTPALPPSLTPISTNTPTLPPSPTPTLTLALALTPTFTPSPAPTSTPTPPPIPTPFPPTSASPLGPWEPLPTDGLPGPWVSDIGFATPEIVFIVAGGNVYRSNDGGATWAESLSIYRAIQSIAISPAFTADETIFAVDGGSRLFRSTDGGGTWGEVTRIAQVGGASDVGVWLSISPAFPADPTLWASTIGAAYRSTDGGLTWEPFDPGVPLTEDMRLVPHPDYPANPTLEVLDYATIEWEPLPDALLHQPTLLVASDATLLLGTRRGLYRSTDGGVVWSEANAGLPPASVGSLALDSEGAVYATVSLDPRLFRLQTGGTHWESLGLLPENDVGTVSVRDMAAFASAGAPPVLVVTTYDGLFVSRDGGATWDRMEGTGLPRVDFTFPLPLLAANFALDGVAHVLVEGIVYRTEDGGDSWARIDEVSDVARLVETPDQRLIALVYNAVYEWDPALGPEWMRHPARFGEDPVTVRFITDLLAVAIAGDDVHLSQNGGRDWMRIGQSGLDGAFYYLISPRFDADCAIYARGAAMVYVSTDAGRTWVEAGGGLPPCEHYDSPECGLELLGAERSDGGYNVYALVRQDFHSRVWVARAGEEDSVTW